MLVSRIAIATAALVIGSAYALFAQPAPSPKAIGMLLAVGDISSCKEDKDEDWLKDADKTAGLIREAIQQAEAATPKIPYRVILLGDLAYTDGTGDQFKCFAQRWAFDDALKNEAMLPVPGNHDYHTLNAVPYFTHFANNPLVNQNDPKVAPKDGPKKGYYALNFPQADGPWRLIGLNDNFGSDTKEMAAQIEWLEKDLADASHRQNCVLAFWHAPTFSSGRHGHDYKTAPNTPLLKHRPMQKTFSLLYGHGASAVLNGHEHNYEQFHPQNDEGIPVDDGVRLFVVGTGGKQLTADVYDNWEKSSEGGPFGKTRGTHGVLKILLYENRYEWEFLSIEKAVKKKIGKKTVTTMEKKKLELATTSADCNKRKK
jgi:hypothetical protein